MNASNGNNIDIKIINLSKWQVPKPEGSFSNLKGNPGHLAIGHFDIIDVKYVNDSMAHPFLQAYNSSFRHETTANQIYTTQELMVFTDKDDFFSMQYIDEFWEQNSLLFFISLIHVDNEDNIKEITNRIRELFRDENYVYYFSFDYSGIIIFAKDMKLSQYLEYIFQLNYDNQGKKIIRDSYSLYGLSITKLTEYFECIKHNGYNAFKLMLEAEYGQLISEQFSVSVNVGISEFNSYKEFISKLEATGIDYRLFGRHDASIVNDKADISWIIFVQYLLNYDKEYPYFSTYETFVKVPMEKEINYQDGKKDTCDFLGIACSDLKELSDTFCDAFDKNQTYDGQYKLPLHAVINSIFSISGNRFAEDFVLCMYKSFRDFILYLTDKLSCDDENSEENFDQCYSEYFKGLSSLVNSAMHSERQFIQATAFNAIIYDIPSKIMAFYVAMINKLQSILHMENDKRYTFFLTPSFSNQISVKIFSYAKEVLPHDRLLLVTINEESLFNPYAVIRRMAHEIAHFEGDILRDRKKRKDMLKETLVYTALSKILYKTFIEDDLYISLGKEICKLLDYNIKLNSDKFNYSNDLYDMGEYIYLGFEGNKSIEETLEKHVEQVIKKSSKDNDLHTYLSKIADNYLSNNALVFTDSLTELSSTQLKILTNLIMKDVKIAIEYLNVEQEIAIARGEIDTSIISETNHFKNILGDYADILISIYSESFADIHMILLTGISYPKYIIGFADEENCDVDSLPQRARDHSRISTVSLIMYLTGMWTNVLDNDLGLSSKSAKLHNMIKEKVSRQIKDLSGELVEEIIKVRKLSSLFRARLNIPENIDFNLPELINSVNESSQYDFFCLPSMDDNLFVYLLNCMKSALEQYNEKIAKIREVREVINKVVKFENVEEVFSVMCNEINNYKTLLKEEIEAHENE